MRRLWHFNTMKVERKRYFEPITASMALAGLTAGVGTAGVGAGIFSMFNKKKKSNDDPLSGIRAQLQSLASQVPGQVAERKKQIGDIYGEARKTGLENVGESIHAERGFGATTLEDRLRVDLLDKLAKSQAQDELSAEMEGLNRQASILGQAGGLAAQEQPEQPSALSQLLGAGTEFAMQQAGMSSLEKILGGTKTTGAGTSEGKSFFSPQTFEEDLDTRKGNLSFTKPYTGYSQ